MFMTLCRICWLRRNTYATRRAVLSVTSKATASGQCATTCPARRSTVSAGAASPRPPRRPGASLWCCPTPARRCQCRPRERPSSVRPSCPPGGPCDRRGPPLPRDEGVSVWSTCSSGFGDRHPPVCLYLPLPLQLLPSKIHRRFSACRLVTSARRRVGASRLARRKDVQADYNGSLCGLSRQRELARSPPGLTIFTANLSAM